MATTYGHHETCGICHTSGPCKHTMIDFSAHMRAHEEAPRKVDVEVIISAKTKHRSFEIDQDTITWYKLLNETTQEVVSEMAKDIEERVLARLQDKCAKRNGHKVTDPHMKKVDRSVEGHDIIECSKCGKTRPTWCHD